MTINRDQVIRDMSTIQVAADRDGLIPAFSVLITQMPATFWNTFASRMLDRVDDNLKPAVEDLLINAANECGYHTGHGIITSEEWDSIVGPSVDCVEDVLEGAFAVFTAWGWGDTSIVELVPGERMVIHTKSYYEADEGEVKNPRRPGAYMLRGVCSAFMDLAYGGEYDPTGNTGRGTFQCDQTKGVECGDDIGEFVITRTRTE